MKLGSSRAGPGRGSAGLLPGVHELPMGIPAPWGTSPLSFHRKCSLWAPGRPFLTLVLLVSIKQAYFVTGHLISTCVGLILLLEMSLYPALHTYLGGVKVDRYALLSTLQLMYTVGYSFSLISLFLALTLLLFLRKLHCTRNYIHMNLFASFILRTLAVLVKDVVFYNSYSKRPDNENGWMSYLSEMSTSCRSVQVLLHYFVGANYLWLLVEGLYLHTLLEPTVLPERRLWPRYLLLGWAFPVLFVVPWGFARAHLENTGCWTTNGNKKIWWIIRGPMMLCVTVNFFIFLKILKLLISKLKAHQMCFRDYKYRLAKSTLVLIPLLGVHEILFSFITDDQVEGFAKLIRLFIQLTLSSFHGFLVALQYGFANGEVKAELRKYWVRFLLARHSGCRACVLGKDFRFLGKCPKKLSEGDGAEKLRKLQPSLNSGRLLHLAMRGLGELGAQPQQDHARWPRGSSLSECSEGDVTMANTMEEILEESEI
ncbi:glucagon-like peptide 2 receptor isoform X3 [Homo sapiens]|uniref:glucagon-like peptide 2 receptor isoform X3 n=2 Tax=Homo sapiens TaxID=9606 RepID=UPI0007DC4F30|nr:glucagon-like peptide 2 receptor isoform X3 [Homo sapiens]XP_054173791.1 glucagon-like peptide 2 receptor isoform X3 [Homo sapiens]|eukprot:XP_016880829.1 glucagon-like peptide 2 receptor isoform X3 [Homo sapiens]